MRSTRVVIGAAWTPVLGLLAARRLADVCTTTYIQSVLPGAGFLQGVEVMPSSVTANAVTNFTVTASSTSIGVSGRDFCNVTFSYARTGRSDKVNLWFYLPSPEQFRNRFLATGGGGYSITSGERGLVAGLIYGTATGTTDGGFGGWKNDLTSVILRADGTLNYDMLYAYGYTAIHEMTVLGKELTRKFYAPPKLYSYFQGCSEGGREGFSQIQRYGSQFDGAALGAPAFRQAFLQVFHLFPPTVETTLGYFPSPCELEKIHTDAIAACDPLDGLLDGVVSRTDLCRLHYNATASIGTPYSCPATTPPNRAPSPATSGTVTPAAAAIANTIWRGFFDSRNRQVYISFPPSAPFSDAATSYNPSTSLFEASPAPISIQYINLFLRETRSPTLSLRNVTYDTLRSWILEGMQKFSDTLQTTWPDLEPFRSAGGKVIHWHGESDGSIPVAGSIMYHEAVRKTMYPSVGFNESYARMNEWYRLFLVPGAGHCSPSVQQVGGAFPTDVLGSVIGWVEEGVEPVRLEAVVQGGRRKGREERLCSWPLRPVWKGEGGMECVYDQGAIDSWLPEGGLDSIPVPVY